MPGIQLKGHLFRSSGLAPTTQDWAAGLRGASSAPPALPQKHSKKRGRVDMLALASHAREWRREQRKCVRELFDLWRRRARMARRSGASPPPRRQRLEFRFRVEALAVTEAFVRWRARVQSAHTTPRALVEVGYGGILDAGAHPAAVLDQI